MRVAPSLHSCSPLRRYTHLALVLLLLLAAGAGALYAASTTTLVVAVSSGTVAEGDTVTVDVTLTEAVLEGPVTITLATSDGPAGAGGAEAPADYTAVSQSLTFDPGETTRRVTIATAQDTLDELNEVFDVTATVTAAPGGVTVLGSPRAAIVVIADDDSQDLVSFTGPSMVAEGAGTADFTLTLGGATAQAVRVDYSVTGGPSSPAATPGSDTTAASGTWFIPAGASSANVSLALTDDALDEPDEYFSVAITAVSGVNNPAFATTLGASDIVLADDDGQPALAVDSPTAAEGTGGSTSLVFTVSLVPASAQTVTVNYATADGSATAGSDYTAAAGTLSFAPGETSKQVSVPVTADAASENDETLTLTLSSPANATLGTASGTGTIRDDDAGPAISVADATATETDTGSDTTATFTVSLSGASGRTITVTYATADGTATSGSDYTTASGTLTFAPGETSKQVSITVTGDNAYEGDETFALNLSGPSNASLGDGSATATLRDNDRPAAQFALASSSLSEPSGSVNLSVTLDNAVLPGDSVSVPFTVGGSVSGADATVTPASPLTFAPGESSKTIALSVADDTLDEDPETLVLTLTSEGTAALGAQTTHTVTIGDDDAEPVVRFSAANSAAGEGVGSTNIVVELSAASGKTVTVDYTVADGSATSADYSATAAGTLSFAAGQTTRTLPVSIADDALSETSETVLLTLANPAGASLGTAAHTLLIDDNDGPPQVLFDTAGSSAGESAGSATIDIVLTSPAGQPVLVDVARTNGTAATPGDYSFSPATVTFAPNETRKSVSVTIAGNGAYQLDRTVVLGLSNLSTSVPGVAIGATAAHTLTIEDDDGPTIAFAQAGASTPEGVVGGKHSVTVTLSQAILPGDSATVTLVRGGTASTPADYSSPATLTFAAGESSTSFDITLVDDQTDASDITVALTLSPVAGSNLTLGNPDTFTLTIADDDETPVAAGETYTTAEDTAFDLPPPGLLANDSDSDGDALTVVLVSGPAHGTAALGAGGALRYVPAANFHGADSISYKLRDPGGNESAIVTAQFTVTPVNDAPAAAADSYAMPEGAALVLAAPGILANDMDVDGDALTIELLSEPSSGTLVLGTGGALTYAPAAGFNGSDSFTYRINDGTLASAPATVTLRVGRAHVVMAPLVIGRPGVPDLVGTFELTPEGSSFSSSQQVLVTVTVTNTGTGPTASGFWVDLYVNPAQVPSAANLRWEMNCGIDPCRGIAWYVDRVLAPGESVVLRSLRGSYVDESTLWDGRLPAGARSMYIFVDSWNPTVATGAVPELDERNNLVGRTDVRVTGLAPATLQSTRLLPAERPRVPR
jgi:hypothetical protein